MKNLIYIISFAFLIFGCSKSAVENEEETPIDPVENPDSESELMVNLVFPHEDGLCNLGTNITQTQSTVFFEWQASRLAERYIIVVENLITGAVIQDETTEDKIGIVIDRATPYAWYVESISRAETDVSEVWKFFNAGPGVQSYAPFPALLNTPEMAAVVTGNNVTLKWSGSDVDNDISTYDVYFGTNNNPSNFESNITADELNVTVNSGSVYYWKIVTKDAEGNTSESDVFQFKVL